MAVPTFYAPASIGTIGGVKIVLGAGVRDKMMKLYRPLAQLVVSVGIAQVRVDSAYTFLRVRTDNKDLEVHAYHPSETDGHAVWIISYGNHGDGRVYNEEYHEDTPYEIIAARIDHLVRLVNVKDYRDKVRASKAAKRKTR